MLCATPNNELQHAERGNLCTTPAKQVSNILTLIRMTQEGTITDVVFSVLNKLTFRLSKIGSNLIYLSSYLLL